MQKKLPTNCNNYSFKMLLHVPKEVSEEAKTQLLDKYIALFGDFVLKAIQETQAEHPSVSIDAAFQEVVYKKQVRKPKENKHA